MQLDFDGKPKDEVAIELIQAWDSKINPMYGGFSGGIDSQIIYDLAQRADANVDWVYNESPIDPQITRDFIKEKYPMVKFENHSQGFFTKLFMVNGMPLRTQRWCCGVIKECGGIGRIKLLGMRAEESNGRTNYCYFMDASRQGQGTKWLLPIVNWTNVDRWQYLLERGIKPNPLYKLGFSRTGCVLCPNQTKFEVELSLKYFPQIVNCWRKACDRYITYRWQRWDKYTKSGKINKRIKKPTFNTGEEYFNWCIKR